jgi:hypothetical protein
MSRGDVVNEIDRVDLPWRRSSRSGSSGGNCVEVAPVWRKSSRSGPTGGNCVEVAAAPDRVAVRDSKDPGGPVLTFSPVAWRSFVRRLPG